MCSPLNTAEILLENNKSNCLLTPSVLVASSTHSTIPFGLIQFLNDESKALTVVHFRLYLNWIFKFWWPSIGYAINGMIKNGHKDRKISTKSEEE